MYESSLQYLRCVRCGNCLGLQTFENKNEINEGLLTCKICKNRYPIISSIPILVEDLSSYLSIRMKLGGYLMLNTKNPLRDEKNSIIGTFAYCMDITNEIGLVKKLLSSVSPNQFSNNEIKLMKGSYILSQTDATSMPIFSLPQADNTELTPRQLECAILYVKGFTVKETAKILKLSPRTVGHYIENIKDKYNCSKKHELITCLLKLNSVKAGI